MRAVTFGEVLWDDFGEKKEIGGAPFNLAAHLSRIGIPTGMISAVGADALGADTLDAVDAFGIDRRLIQTVSHPTGVCRVSKDANGHPSYDLVTEVAYDHITMDAATFAELQNTELFCFGTLAQRGEVSRATLAEILEKCCFPHVFCDLNIRQSYYDRDSVWLCLTHCDILKISREEIGVLNELGICRELPDAYPTETDYFTALCTDLAERFNIDILLITLDKDGAMLYEKASNRVLISSVPQSKPISTVGAGDSFSAAFLAHYLNGDNLEKCLECAIALSDYVVTRLGAVPDYPPELYSKIKL